MPDTLKLRETTAASLSEAAVNQNGQVLLRLIAPGWSKNGRYYSENLLQRDGLRVFREGVQTYLDHPSATDKEDRPERSVRDLVGALTENSYYDPKGPLGPGLYAHASVRTDYKPIVNDLAEVIGMSIRADGTGHHGEADGREGLIVDSIEAAKSVDYVTQPAAGGRIVELLESVQNPDRGVDPDEVVANAVAQGMSEATANETREALANAIREQYSGERQYAWVRDFDDSTVWFEREAGDESGTFQQAYSIDDNMQVTLTGDPVEVRVETRYVPITPASADESIAEAATDQPEPPATPDPPASPAGTNADPSAPTDVTESTPEEGAMTDNPGAGTAPTPHTARSLIESELAEARRGQKLAEARERARGVLSQALSEGWVPPATVARITESLMGRLPLTQTNDLDEAELVKMAARELTQAETEMAEALAAAGVGRPRDLGYTPEHAGGLAKERIDERLTESFAALGLSEEATKIAVKGRG